MITLTFNIDEETAKTHEIQVSFKRKETLESRDKVEEEPKSEVTFIEGEEPEFDVEPGSDFPPEPEFSPDPESSPDPEPCVETERTRYGITNAKSKVVHILRDDRRWSLCGNMTIHEVEKGDMPICRNCSHDRNYDSSWPFGRM